MLLGNSLEQGKIKCVNLSNLLGSLIILTWEISLTQIFWFIRAKHGLINWIF